MTPPILGTPRPDVKHSPTQRSLQLANLLRGILVVDSNNIVIAKFAQSSASRRQRAKDVAAHTAYQWLCALYPTIDLLNI